MPGSWHGRKDGIGMRFVHTADWQLGMTRHFLAGEAQPGTQRPAATRYPVSAPSLPRWVRSSWSSPATSLNTTSLLRRW
ncbi:DNA repair exonuclease SbcD domain protein [Mycobacterium xenopi 4042]|uniref:DNA repair exonuclease SbcD domain protein n=1 Tax=Mycobacterium xenopi 4042 TaxID=1299334 RepID=X8DZN7_MYCXE|nr:DNA repair exonuclease SbcD domain protein [Mycobacterium xenopi 4042]